ncbi:MAG: glycosyltransferase, partial [Marinicaulis sp.]|nr:glycosyltransferase [Marinicaulis sp.]
MDVVLSTPAFILSALGFSMSFWLALEVAGAFVGRRRRKFDARTRTIAVIVPAHNEAGVIKNCLQSITGQLKARDRVIVVADNCTDSTCDVARAAGAECLERENQNQRGKGFALQFGIDHLASDP